MDRLLITGATGFIGKALVSRLSQAGYSLTLACRNRPQTVTGAVGAVRHIIVGDISGTTDWTEALRGCDVVIHLAGQTSGHGVEDERFRVVNDQATGRLVEQASFSGVRLFLFMSSIAAVVGHASDVNISDYTNPAPVSWYGKSKLAAEAYVDEFAKSGGVGISLRPPMVYGAAAGGNWRVLQKLAASNLPLPFGAVSNRRAAISVDNLVDAIFTLIRGAGPYSSGAFAVTDAETTSVGDMLRYLREGMKLPHRLFQLPPSLLSTSLRLIRKGAIVDSLLGDLVVDSKRFCEAFSWTPVEDGPNAIRRAGAEFLAAAR